MNEIKLVKRTVFLFIAIGFIIGIVLMFHEKLPISFGFVIMLSIAIMGKVITFILGSLLEEKERIPYLIQKEWLEFKEKHKS